MRGNAQPDGQSALFDRRQNFVTWEQVSVGGKFMRPLNYYF